MVVKDQLNREVHLKNFPPKRIVSLVPSQSELLADLKLDDQVVGITKFCVHPKDWWQNKSRVGGTKNYNLELIKKLNPDLIIANKEENSKESLMLLMDKYPVWISDVRDYSSAINMIKLIGEITDRKSISKSIIKNINQSFKTVFSIKRNTKKVAYIIWNNPIMSINSNTFINEMLKISGLENVFAKSESRYPKITINELKNAAPDLIFLSTEPFPFSEKHINFFKENIPASKVVLVNGEYFSWYGSRLLLAANYLNKLNKELSLD